MSNKSVVVLAPNGKRQKVNVTSNTTILQVLEEVCKKHGYKPEEYDITHHNKVLDATSIMRFTGLPNNAQLEMAVALKTRSETAVKVGLALESGDRVLGEFHPSDSLWHVVKTLCPDEADANEPANILPVIFYMGREECGTENLKKTTLRCLGLTRGGAILRFFKKTPEELRYQANVSAPLSRPCTVVDEPSRISSTRSHSKSVLSNLDDLNSPSTSGLLKADLQCNQDVTSEPSSFHASNSPHASVPEVTPDSVSVREKSESEVLEMDYEDSSETSQVPSSHTSLPSSSVAACEEPEETIVFLGERNAILFDMATASACKPEDVPDDFFDLTLDDAKQLLRDLKRRQASLEQQPLVTSRYRELEKSKQMLNALNQYKRCVIRIQFPNQLVLQGTFTPLEKVSHVMEFVKGFLEDPNINFHIFTTPPKVVLNPELTLYDASCVPGAVVHFISESPCPEHGCHLKIDIMAQVSSATVAASAALKTRGIVNTRPSNSSAISSGAVARNSEEIATHTSASSSPLNINKPTSSQTTVQQSDKKVPKWFKPSNH